MAHVVMINGVVVAMSDIPQPGLPGAAELTNDDPRVLAFLAPATASATLATKIAAGITITSAATPALNATYALDSVTLTQIQAVAQDSAAGMGLPGNAATFSYPDIKGQQHTFTASQLIAVYRAMRDLLWVLNTQGASLAHGTPAKWPVQTAVIA